MDWRARLRYRFDEFMGRGTIALIVGLFVISVVLIVTVAFIVFITGHEGEDDLDFPALLRLGLLRTLDPGTMGGDTGTGGFLLSMLVVTLGGIFIISTLIGILNTGLEGKLAELRKGRSSVVEREHTVILGWSQQIFTVISEIVEANANQSARSIVILADRDKVEMEDEIKARVGKTGKTKLVCRSGSPMDLDDLGSSAPRPHARSSSSRPRATSPTPTSSRRSSRSPTIRLGAPSRTTSSPRSAIARTSRSRGWSEATRSSSSCPRRSSRGSRPRPAASPACRSSTPSCSTSPATRSTSPSSRRSRVGRSATRWRPSPTRRSSACSRKAGHRTSTRDRTPSSVLATGSS